MKGWRGNQLKGASECNWESVCDCPDGAAACPRLLPHARLPLISKMPLKNNFCKIKNVFWPLSAGMTLISYQRGGFTPWYRKWLLMAPSVAAYKCCIVHICHYRTGMRTWLHLRWNEQRRAAQTSVLRTRHLTLILAGTQIFLFLVSTPFLKWLSPGSRREKTLTTWVGHAERTPPVSTTHRY